MKDPRPLRAPIGDLVVLLPLADKRIAAELTKVQVAIVDEGLNLSRATAVFSVLRDRGTAQCVECQTGLAAAPPDTAETNALETDARRPGRKSKGPMALGRDQVGGWDEAEQPVWTRACYHAVAPNSQRPCSACQTTLVATVDAIQVAPNAVLATDQMMGGASAGKSRARNEQRKKGGPLQSAKHSTKIKALMDDLMPFSRANMYSINYDPSTVEIQSVDKDGNLVDDGPTKSVVFSQWTSMLDKIDDALEEAAIRFSRLDGTMKREDCSRAMDALKTDPSCEYAEAVVCAQASRRAREARVTVAAMTQLTASVVACARRMRRERAWELLTWLVERRNVGRPYIERGYKAAWERGEGDGGGQGMGAGVDCR
ncbi:hypothetical protein BDV93DRAFT_559104 [Ceratobasidium sp. AG-I]|nr:hypothetical protein BDV93DRAFT_559104 [Ceratobasidium sp. AG-I]